MPTEASGELYFAEWEVSGPAFQSREDVRYGQGRLGVDYTENVDTRWGVACLGPQLNAVDLSAVGGTTANSNGAALTGGMNATLFLVVIRGTDPALVKISDMTASDPALSLSVAANSVLYTKNAAGTEEISIGLDDSTSYHCITGITNGTTITASANDDAIKNRVMAYGWPGNVILGGGGQVLRQNDLSGTTTMDNGSWSTRATITGENFTFTSIAHVGSFVVLGTTNGPYVLDNDFAEFSPIYEEIGQDADNCKQMAPVSWLNGILCPTKKALYLIRSGGWSRTVGPERFGSNESGIQGRITAIAPADRWLYVVIYNESAGNYWLCAARPPEPGEPFQDKVLVYFPLADLDDNDCLFLKDIDTANGTRTSPTLIGGRNSDMFYMTQGRLAREIDDTLYRFATAGTWYGTEMERYSSKDKVVEWVEVVTEGCTSTETVTVKLAFDGNTAETYGTISANGFHRLEVKGNLRGFRIKPQMVFASGANTASPKVRRLRVFYRLAPRPVDNRVPKGA